MRPDYRVWRLRPRGLLLLVPLVPYVWLQVARDRGLAVHQVLVVGVLLVITVLRVRIDSVRLQVDDRGVLLGTNGRSSVLVRVPWTSVRRVVVHPTARTVGLLLTPDAPRPPGLRGMIRDPARPDVLDPQLVREVPGLNASAVRAAVEARGVAVGSY